MLGEPSDLMTGASPRSSDRIVAVTMWHANTYGPADPHASHIVTATILSLLRGEAPVIKSDGSPSKDYLYVDDTIAAYLALAEAVAKGHALQGAYNSGPALPMSVRELVAAIIRVSGRAVEPDVLATDLSQQGYREHLDSMALWHDANWSPRVLPEDGLARTWAWYREHQGMAWAR